MHVYLHRRIYSSIRDLRRPGLRHFVPLLIALITLLAAQCVFAQGPTEEATPAEPKMWFIQWVIQVSGIIGFFIFCLSVYFVAIVVKSYIDLRLSVAAPPDVLNLAEKLIEERNAKELVKVLQEDNSYYSKILLAGISELRYGLDDGRDKLERKAESLTGEMERSISNLAVLGTLGPMIGLLGTLQGMISSFSAIAMMGVSLDTVAVADGISQALVLTFEGVLLSVPAIYFFSLFRNRISRIHLETSNLADAHLKAVARLLKSKGAQGAE